MLNENETVMDYYTRMFQEQVDVYDQVQEEFIEKGWGIPATVFDALKRIDGLWPGVNLPDEYAKINYTPPKGFVVQYNIDKFAEKQKECLANGDRGKAVWLEVLKSANEVMLEFERSINTLNDPNAPLIAKTMAIPEIVNQLNKVVGTVVGASTESPGTVLSILNDILDLRGLIPDLDLTLSDLQINQSSTDNESQNATIPKIALPDADPTEPGIIYNITKFNFTQTNSTNSTYIDIYDEILQSIKNELEGNIISTGELPGLEGGFPSSITITSTKIYEMVPVVTINKKNVTTEVWIKINETRFFPYTETIIVPRNITKTIDVNSTEFYDYVYNKTLFIPYNRTSHLPPIEVNVNNLISWSTFEDRIPFKNITTYKCENKTGNATIEEWVWDKKVITIDTNITEPVAVNVTEVVAHTVTESVPQIVTVLVPKNITSYEPVTITKYINVTNFISNPINVTKIFYYNKTVLEPYNFTCEESVGYESYNELVKSPEYVNIPIIFYSQNNTPGNTTLQILRNKTANQTSYKPILENVTRTHYIEVNKTFNFTYDKTEWETINITTIVPVNETVWQNVTRTVFEPVNQTVYVNQSHIEYEYVTNTIYKYVTRYVNTTETHYVPYLLQHNYSYNYTDQEIINTTLLSLEDSVNITNGEYITPINETSYYKTVIQDYIQTEKKYMFYDQIHGLYLVGDKPLEQYEPNETALMIPLTKILQVYENETINESAKNITVTKTIWEPWHITVIKPYNIETWKKVNVTYELTVESMEIVPVFVGYRSNFATSMCRGRNSGFWDFDYSDTFDDMYGQYRGQPINFVSGSRYSY